MSNVNENFRKILDNISAVTEKLGFSAYKDENGDFVTEKDGAVSARYTGEKGVIEVRYEEEKISIFSGDDPETPENTPKRLTASLLSDSTDERDVKYIISDFSETINEKFGVKAPVSKRVQQQKAQHTVSKAAVKNGSFYDPSTLASKLCLVFPDLRPYYKENIEKYGEFLGEEFFTKYGTAKVIEAIKQNNPQTMKKLFQILNEIYEDGTNDTQSLIAVTILGELGNDQILLSHCVDYMSETMAPPVIEVNKYLASAAGKKAKKKLLNPPAYKPKKQKKPGMFSQAMAGGMQPPIQ